MVALGKTSKFSVAGQMVLEGAVRDSMQAGTAGKKPPRAQRPSSALQRPDSVLSNLRPDLAADLASQMEELEGLRGPERLFYDASSWPASYQYNLVASPRRPRRRESPSSSRRGSPSVDCSSRTASRPGTSMASSDKSDGTQATAPKVFRKQPRVCVMCDHCWKAAIPDTRSYLLKCPNCLSDQPRDDELLGSELRAMAEKCKIVFAEREAEAAERRKCRLAERSRLRMYDQPWTPQLASQHNRELAQAYSE